MDTNNKKHIDNIQTECNVCGAKNWYYDNMPIDDFLKRNGQTAFNNLIIYLCTKCNQKVCENCENKHNCK